MPFHPGKKEKRTKAKKQNQGDQWGDTGSPGNIHTVSREGTGGYSPDPPTNSKHGRDKSIGRGRKEVK